MPITLIESREAGPGWQQGGQAALSTTIHATLIVLAVLGTPGMRRTIDEAAKPAPERLAFVRPPEPVKRKPAPKPAAARAATPTESRTDAQPDLTPPVGFQVLVAPIDIPLELPPIDETRAVTDEADFSGRGVEGGVARVVADGDVLPPPTDGQPYNEFQVEKIAMRAGGCAPRFPEMLARAGISGSVTVQFVIDTTGRADPGSFITLSGEHDMFAKAIKRALSCMRYLPAEVGGRKVRQLVQQPFAFVLAQR